MTDAEKTASQSYANEEAAAAEPVRPDGWMYKSIRVAGKQLPWYASPPIQLIMVAFVCFLCPGMYNSLTGLGGGGQINAKDNDNAQVALYSTFSVVGFFAGTFANRMGLKITLSFGGLGYFIYSSSLLCYNHTQNAGFLIFAGALLGVCAGLLWCAQGAIMMSYPPEHAKGRYISWFWIIFNMGAVIGSLIPLGQNLHTTKNGVNDGTYVAFMVLMFIGAIFAWTLIDSKHVQRKDGSKVILMKHPTWQSEIWGLWECLQTDTYIIALFPMFFASNWFYTYQFNDVNLAKFNVRTRSLDSTLYWSSQIVGALIFGYALDIHTIRRSTRAKAALATLFVITIAIWGGGWAWQKNYTRADTSPEDVVKEDWSAPGYVGPMFLYMFYGFYDAAWQTCVYWFMGALTNNGRKTAHFAAFYKGIQSAGAAITYRLDALETPFVNMYASCFALLGASLLIAAPVIVWKIKDHSDVEEDLKFSDEAIEEVVPVSQLPAALATGAETKEGSVR